MNSFFVLPVFLFVACFAGNVGSRVDNDFGSIFPGPIFGSTAAARIAGLQQTARVNDPAPEGISPCMRELGTRGNGRYPRQIAAQFLPGIVIPFDVEDESRQNLMCSCVSYDHMICMIWVQADSFAHQVVLRRLDRSDPNELRPFYVLNDAAMSSSMEPPIYFEHSECDPRVYARIDISLKHDRLPMGTEIKFRKPQSETDLLRPRFGFFRRINSAPASFHFPTRRFPLSLCNQGSDDAVCPIEQMPFQANDIVYVLKQDRDNVDKGKPVCCISALGLKKIQRNSDDGIFREPLRRIEGSHLTIENAYDAYVIFDDTGLIAEDFGSQAGPSFSSFSDEETQEKPHSVDESSQIRPQMTDESAQVQPQVVDESTQARAESIDEGIQAQPRTSDEGVQTQFQSITNARTIANAATQTDPLPEQRTFSNAETEMDPLPEQQLGNSFTSISFLHSCFMLLTFYIFSTAICFSCWEDKPSDYVLIV